MMKATVLLSALVCVLPVSAAASNAPQSATFHDPDTGASCGVSGKAKAKTAASLARFDPDLNKLKNRDTLPDSTTATTVAEFRNLPTHDKEVMRNWTQGDLQTFEPLEAQAVRIQGYLLGVKQEGQEATNCGATDAAGIDFHMWLVDSDDADKDRSFAAVVEVTPRWRQANPAWSCSALYGLIEDGGLVRISGYRLYDYEHPEQLPENNTKNPTRSTLWEIHPITKIEVATDQGWLELGAPGYDAAGYVKARGGTTYSTKCRNTAGGDE